MLAAVGSIGLIRRKFFGTAPARGGLDDLKARIAKTIDYVQSARAAAFEGAEDRAILFPLIENLVFDSNGFEYLRDWALPHFYFHVVTAYDILRHNGVEIGKRDYLSHTGIHIHPRA